MCSRNAHPSIHLRLRSGSYYYGSGAIVMLPEQDPISHSESSRRLDNRRPRPCLHLLYHELRPEKSNYSYSLECEQFEGQVDLFARLQEAQNPGSWPEITFDDGHISNYAYALPILQTRGIRGRFFITVGWTGRRAGYMNWDELRCLHKAGHPIGSHGWTHTLLTHCTSKELQLELNGARETLEDALGAPVTTMSLPGGRFNRQVLEACREAGYIKVYTSIPRLEPMPPGPVVGRLNIRGDCSLTWVESLLTPGSRVLANLQRQERLKSAARAALGDRIYAKIWAILNGQEAESRAG